jgi:exonuclease SbcD
MLEDQAYILKVILGVADDEKPRAALIAGDVFDRSVAPAEALRLFDDFLDGLVRREIEVFIISGNHDSADRLAFGSRLMERSGVHISRVYDGRIAPYALSDGFGELDVYLLPFLKPAPVKRFFPEAEITTWTEALETVIKNMKVNESRRNVLLAHQFVTGAISCESEEINVGGAENVDAEIFSSFDYVALGHLHGAQNVGRKTLRYCGSPLKYSFSEAKHEKTVTVVEFAGKRDVAVREIPLIPKRDMREIRGKYLEVSSRDFYRGLNLDDYYRVTLTDEDDMPDAIRKLRVIYPNLMRLDYDNLRTRTESSALEEVADASRYTPIQLFDMLYEDQNGRPLQGARREFLTDLIGQVWEDAK